MIFTMHLPLSFTSHQVYPFNQSISPCYRVLSIWYCEKFRQKAPRWLLKSSEAENRPFFYVASFFQRAAKFDSYKVNTKNLIEDITLEWVRLKRNFSLEFYIYNFQLHHDFCRLPVHPPPVGDQYHIPENVRIS